MLQALKVASKAALATVQSAQNREQQHLLRRNNFISGKLGMENSLSTFNSQLSII
jgi:hypothetical protein